MVTRMKDEGVDKCYVSTFDRTQVVPPAVDLESSMVRYWHYFINQQEISN